MTDINEVINDLVLEHSRAPYDPVDAHNYYMRTRELKGRKPAAPKTPSKEQHIRDINRDNEAKISRLVDDYRRTIDFMEKHYSPLFEASMKLPEHSAERLALQEKADAVYNQIHAIRDKILLTAERYGGEDVFKKKLWAVGRQEQINKMLKHSRAPYDPIDAHNYYMRTRELKGRKPAAPKLTPAQMAKGKGFQKQVEKLTKDFEDLSQRAKEVLNSLSLSKAEKDKMLKTMGPELKKLQTKMKALSKEYDSDPVIRRYMDILDSQASMKADAQDKTDSKNFKPPKPETVPFAKPYDVYNA